MRRWGALLWVLLAPEVTLAQSDVPPGPDPALPAPTAALVPTTMSAPSAELVPKLKTVIMGVKPQRGADADLCRSLEQLVQGEVMADPTRVVIGRGELKQLMQLEAEKAAMGCEADSCLAEIADALDADRVVMGTVDRLGSSFFVVLTELDARQVRVISRVQKRLSTNEDRLFAGVELMASELVRSGGTSGDTGTLVVTTTPPAEVFVDGESYGGTPAVIGELPPGVVEVELISGEDRLSVEAPVAYAKSTKIDAQLSITKGPTIEEIRENAQAAFWGGVLSLGEILVGGPTLLCSPAFGCGFGLAMAYVTGFGFDDKGDFAPFATLTFWSMSSAAGLLMFSVATALLGLSATTFVFGPDVPDMGAPEHKVLITPAEGEGDPVRFKIDPSSGATEEVPLLPTDREQMPMPSSAAAAAGWVFSPPATAMAH